MRAIGWATIGMATLLVVAGLLIGVGGPITPPGVAPQVAIAIARVAPWPVLVPLAVVLLVVARAAATHGGWARVVAMAIAAIFLLFGLLGAGWPAGGGHGLVVAGKAIWLVANGYVIAALLSKPSRRSLPAAESPLHRERSLNHHD